MNRCLQSSHYNGIDDDSKGLSALTRDLQRDAGRGCLSARESALLDGKRWYSAYFPWHSGRPGPRSPRLIGPSGQRRHGRLVSCKSTGCRPWAGRQRKHRRVRVSATPALRLTGYPPYTQNYTCAPNRLTPAGPDTAGRGRELDHRVRARTHDTAVAGPGTASNAPEKDLTPSYWK